MKTSVLVVGAGPAGLTAALSLARLGVDVTVVTKHSGTANSPRAHITNQRTVEVCRALGIESAVAEIAMPGPMMGNNVWATSFAAPELARLMSWGSGDSRLSDYAVASPCVMCNAGQHLLEPVLHAAASEAGARFAFATEFVALEQDGDRVVITVRDRTSGEKRLIEADFVIGADGANSSVASAAGIGMTGQSGLGKAINAWLEVDLTKYCAHRPSSLYWMVRPGNDYWVGSGTWINVRPWNEWVLLFMYDPADGEPDTSDEAIIARARTTIGDPDIPIRVKSVSRWQINHVLADHYRSGRVFIAGDAAHRHPPANGLGSNTSIQDAFNLAWKLAFVIKGHASDTLLDSYEAERRPVGRQVVDRAMNSVAAMAPISEALGFRPGQTEAEGWVSLDLLGAATAEGAERRARLAQAVELQNYQFNANGVELGQTYASDAVVTGGASAPAPARDPELYYEPSTFPGRHLPHAWVARGRERLSTLDLCVLGGLTVVTGVGGEAWEDAAAKVSAELGVPIATVAVGPRRGVDDILGDWRRLRGVAEDGCVLVRPDRFVAWRAVKLAADPAGALRQAVATILGVKTDGEIRGRDAHALPV